MILMAVTELIRLMGNHMGHSLETSWKRAFKSIGIERVFLMPLTANP